MKYLTAILLYLIAINSAAQDLDSLVKQLNLDESKIKTDLVVYKIMPNNKAETIVVIPEIAAADETGELFELNSHILIVDTKTQKIINKYFESAQTNGWFSDAVVLSKISIDTAAYNVSPTNRAFGIRVHYRGSSRANPYDDTTLTLFIKSNNGLKKILNNYSVESFNGEWDTNCAGEFIDNKKLLIMAANKTNGFYDLIVKNKITSTKNFEAENKDCDYKENISTKQTVLKFNNSEYR